MRQLHVLHLKENNEILIAESTQEMIKGCDRVSMDTSSAKKEG